MLQSDAGPDMPYACNETTLDGSNPAFGYGYWTCNSTDVVFDDESSATANVSNLPHGDTEFVWHVVNNGCESTDTMYVTNNTPFPVHAGADDEACRGDSIQLNGTQPTLPNTGRWIVLGGAGNFNDQSLYHTWVTDLDPVVDNVFRWLVENDYCSASDTVEITNNSIDVTNFTNPGPYCTDVGYLSVMCPPAGATGTWENIASPGIVQNPNSCFTAVTGLTFDANTFKWVVESGNCKDSIEVTIYAYPVEATANASAPEVCTDYVDLYGNDPSSYGGVGVWSIGPGSATFDNQNSPTTFATGLNNTTTNHFTWTVQINGCTASASVEVEYNAPTQAIIGNDTPATTCDGTYTLNANPPSNGNETGYWETTTGGVTYNPDNSTATTIVSNLTFGQNMFVWHITNGMCPESTDTIWVDNQLPPVVDAGGPYADVCDECIGLAATDPSPGTGIWSATPQITFTDNTSNSSQVCNLNFGPNVLRWTVTIDQCSAWDEVVVNNNQGDPAITEADKRTCNSTESISALPVTNGSGVWTTTAPGVTIQNSTANPTNVYNLNNGGNIFYWTVSNGNCSSVDQLIVYNDSVSIANVMDTVYICADSTQILANTPVLGQGEWSIFSGNGNFVEASMPNPWIYNIPRGENVYIWTISQGLCSSEDTMHVFNLSVEAINAIAVSPIIVCDDSVVVSGNPPSTQDIFDWQTPPDYPAWGEWTSGGAYGDIVSPSFYQTWIHNLGYDLNVFTWTISNGICSDAVDVQVFNNQPTISDAGLDTIVCNSTLLTLHETTPIEELDNGTFSVVRLLLQTQLSLIVRLPI